MIEEVIEELKEELEKEKQLRIEAEFRAALAERKLAIASELTDKLSRDLGVIHVQMEAIVKQVNEAMQPPEG